MNRIAIIDDNPVELSLLLSAIEAHQMPTKVDVIPHGEAALAHFEKDENLETDLILVNLNLSGMKGFTLLEIFDSEPLLKPIPKIVLADSRAERNVIKAWKSGCNGYFLKPDGEAGYRMFIDSIFQYWLSPQNLPARQPTQRFERARLLNSKNSGKNASDENAASSCQN